MYKKFICPSFKTAHKAMTCWYHSQFSPIINTRFNHFVFCFCFNGQKLIYFLMLYKCIMANTSAIWQQAEHTTYYHLLAVQQVSYKKLNLNEKCLRTFWRKEKSEWTISRQMTRQNTRFKCSITRNTNRSLFFSQNK